MPRRTLQLGGKKLVLDARPDRLDLRDIPYRPRLGSLPDRWPSAEHTDLWRQFVAAGLVLDQGEEGACTGFGLAAVINYQRFVRAAQREHGGRVSPAMLYELARMYDEWPGEDYEGSSCRGALKGWHRHGVCRDALWPYQLDEGGARKYVRPQEDAKNRDAAERNWDVDALSCTLGVYYRIDPRSVVDMQAAILETGAVYCSGSAHEGWDLTDHDGKLGTHDDLARIRHVPVPEDAGGHAFALVGYNELGFVLQNSWGTRWGSQGFALLPYEDWVLHGEDAWVFTLGVSRRQAAAQDGTRANLRAPRLMVPVADALDNRTPERPVGLINASDELQQRYRKVPPAVQPLDPECAYLHSVVLDRGFPVRSDVTEVSAQSELARTAYDRPLAWLEARASNKLLIYAHGGLNSEGASVSRIRTLAPYALHNGIYPLFVTWRSGALETLSDLVEECFAKLGLGARGAPPARGWIERITEKTDRILEPLLRTPGGALWQQMKLNAVRASEHPAGGCKLLVAALQRLKQARPSLEIHLMGHSAGSIVLGAMLPALQRAGLSVSSLRLFAPACSARFALDYYMPAVRDGVLNPKHWHIHTLSEKNERDDSVGPYRKSLLYLVSRSFEDVHKTPILGLEKLFDPTTFAPQAKDDTWGPDERATAAAWYEFWKRLGVDPTNRKAHTLARGAVSNGARSERAAHGCFDNAVDIMGHALGYVLDPNEPRRVDIQRLDY